MSWFTLVGNVQPSFPTPIGWSGPDQPTNATFNSEVNIPMNWLKTRSIHSAVNSQDQAMTSTSWASWPGVSPALTITVPDPETTRIGFLINLHFIWSAAADNTHFRVDFEYNSAPLYLSGESATQLAEGYWRDRSDGANKIRSANITAILPSIAAGGGTFGIALRYKVSAAVTVHGTVETTALTVWEI